MIALEEKWQWYKDALFPLVICLSLLFAVLLYQQGPSAAMEQILDKRQIFYWMLLLFISNAITFVGVVLRRLNKTKYLYFEYPGSIATTFFIWVYSGALFTAHFSNNILAFGISFLLGVHFAFNFMKIHSANFHKKHK